MPDTAMRGIELARTGTWDLATGTVEFTRQKFQDAVDFYAAAGAVPFPVKLGHLTLPEGFEQWDGLPAFGAVTNPRINPADPDSLLGDLVDLPQWLHAAAPRSWPSRSIEAFEGVTYKGRTYSMVLSGLALLGVTPPGVKDIRSLRDLQLAVAASSGARFIAAAAPTLVEETVTQPAPNPAEANPQAPVDPAVTPAVAPELPTTPAAPATPAPVPAGPGNETVPPATPVVPVEPTSTEPAPAPVTPEPPATPGPIPTPKEEDGMADLRAGLRELVGVQDAKASDDDLIAAAREALNERAEPVAASGFVAPKGYVLVPEVAYRDMQVSTEQGVIAAAANLNAERDRTIAEALNAGKILPASRESWLVQYDADPAYTKVYLASAKAIVPVRASGYSGTNEENPEDADFKRLFGADATAKVG